MKQSAGGKTFFEIELNADELDLMWRHGNGESYHKGDFQHMIDRIASRVTRQMRTAEFWRCPECGHLYSRRGCDACPECDWGPGREGLDDG